MAEVLDWHGVCPMILMEVCVSNPVIALTRKFSHKFNPFSLVIGLHPAWFPCSFLSDLLEICLEPPLMNSLLFPDGAYERSMSLCPPPLTMIIFSILEIIAFLIDIIYFQ